MKEYEKNSDYNWHAWFWLDKEEFDGEWKIGQCRYRIEKAVGRGDDGKLFLMVWENLDKYDWHKFKQTFYEISMEEYTMLLDRAIEQGEEKPEERESYIKLARSPFIPPWDIHKPVVVYQDSRYTLGQNNDRPYLIANGKKYILSCHPYEPCLYITDEDGNMTAVHNAFDPFDVLQLFDSGEKVTSITGLEYDAQDFCKMAESAADMIDIRISDAERLAFGDRIKWKKTEPEKKKDEIKTKEEPFCPEKEMIIDADPFYDLIEKYPDSVIDYCLVKNDTFGRGRNAHRYALLWASRNLFLDGEEVIWHFDTGRADGCQISVNKLFGPVDENGPLNYRKAFLCPPYTNNYTNADFDKINRALFPNGTDGLEVFEWTTDWTEYFDEGHEWWGTLCYTVYDKTLDRFAVIMASATD